MNRLLAVIRREYVEAVRTRSFAISTILVPVLMGAMMLLPALLARSTPDEVLRVAVADRTGVLFEGLEREMATSKEDDFLKDGRRRYELLKVDPTVEGAPGPALKSSGADALLDIPAAIMDGEGDPLYFSSNVGDFQPVRRLDRALTKVVTARRLQSLSVPPEQADALLHPVDLKARKVGSDGTVQERDFLTEWMTALFFTIAMYTTTLMAGMALSRGLLEEKSNRVMEVLVSSVSPFQLMTGKILGQALVILSQFGIWTAAGAVLYLQGLGGRGAGQVVQTMTPGLIGCMLVYFLLGYFLYAALFSAVGAVCTSEMEAQQTQTPLVLMQLLPLILAMAIVRRPDGGLAVALSMIPFFSPSVMMMRLALHPPSAGQVLLSMALLAAAVPVVLWAVAKIFRVGILMTGKKMTFPEMARWLRST